MSKAQKYRTSRARNKLTLLFCAKMATTAVSISTPTTSPSVFIYKYNGKKGCKKVVKRSGEVEDFEEHKMYERMVNSCKELTHHIDLIAFLDEIVSSLRDYVSTQDIDDYIASMAYNKVFKNNIFDKISTNILVSNNHRTITKPFHVIMEDMTKIGIIGTKFNSFVQRNSTAIENALRHDRDYDFSFFGLRTLYDKYLLKNRSGRMVERPQHMFMRVAIMVSVVEDEEKQWLKRTLENYELLSTKKYTHATPTLFNACTVTPQLSSCFLVTPQGGSSLEGLVKTFEDIAKISINTGGVGIAMQDYAARGSYVETANAKSRGLIPFLRVMDELVDAIKLDSGNKRQTAVAVYCELWHPDIMTLIEMKCPSSKPEEFAKNLFFGVWVNDLFMERLANNGEWTLMCPIKCPGLSKVYGEEFERLYTDYETKNPDLKRVPCSTIWISLLKAQLESGTPYLCFKDSVNRKSNQKHIGAINCSNLCTEIMEYSSEDETAVCNLASIAVNMFVSKDGSHYDFDGLVKCTKKAIRNLNTTIDVTHYPTEKAKNSNMNHRPVGIGIQGLADAFILMGMSYGDNESKTLNRRIAEHIYYAAVEESCDMAKEQHDKLKTKLSQEEFALLGRFPGAYPKFEGSPASQGKLQFDLWKDEQNEKKAKGYTTKFRPIVTELDWDTLKKEKLLKYGMRNAYTVAPMPTASTAQILGNNEAFEPYTNNIYTRNVTNGMFKVMNKHLYNTLNEKGLWDDGVGNLLMSTRGSVQDIEGLDKKTKEMFRTVWEIPQKTLVDMAIDRAPFVDQSQSLNIFMDVNTFGEAYERLTKMHFYTWRMGLKTGMYYLRTPPSSNATQVAIDHEAAKATRTKILIKAASCATLSNGDKSDKVSDKVAEEKLFLPEQQQEIGLKVNAAMKNEQAEMEAIEVETEESSDLITEESDLINNMRLEVAAGDSDEEKDRLAFNEMICSRVNKEACVMCSS